MKTHAQLMDIVLAQDKLWYDALTAWFTIGTIAAVASALGGDNADAGNARHHLCAALRFYSYIATFNMG